VDVIHRVVDGIPLFNRVEVALDGLIFAEFGREHPCDVRRLLVDDRLGRRGIRRPG
jgi:hypothetical protein